MQNFLRKLKWPDYLILIVLIGFAGYVWYSIEGTLNYKWRWHLIPNYIVGWHTTREEYFANLLLQGLVATIRISIYASILALILGTILGIARCSANLTIRMLARTYLEFLRNIPPVVVIFIFFFFLSQQLIDALNLETLGARHRATGKQRRVGVLFRRDAALSLADLGRHRAGPVRERLCGRNRPRRHPVDPQGPARGGAVHRYEPHARDALYRAAAGDQEGRATDGEPVHSLIKDSSIISLISVQELTYKTFELVASSRMIFEAWITTAAFYFVVCFGLSRLFARLERGRKSSPGS